MCGPQVRFCERFPPANGGRLLDPDPLAMKRKKGLRPTFGPNNRANPYAKKQKQRLKPVFQYR